MWFYASKALQQVIYPLHWVIVGLLLALILLRGRRHRWGTICLVISLLVLFVSSMPLTAFLLMHPLETTYPTLATNDYPPAQAIVVLGGTTAPIWPPRKEPEEPGGARLLAASRLFWAGKAPVVVVSGGARYNTPQGWRSEADDMTAVLRAYRVPAKKILAEDQSRNTDENARFTATLLQGHKPPIKRILLVTSAFHLPRARFLFEQAGFEVVPVPSGHLAYTPDARVIQQWWPTADSLNLTSIAIKEWVGRLVYFMVYA